MMIDLMRVSSGIQRLVLNGLMADLSPNHPTEGLNPLISPW
jgi:hypothetical protein